MTPADIRKLAAQVHPDGSYGRMSKALLACADVVEWASEYRNHSDALAHLNAALARLEAIKGE